MASKVRRSTERWQHSWQSIMSVLGLRRYRLGCSFVPSSEPGNWFTIAPDPRRTTIVSYELALGLERERTRYNLECLEIARRSRKLYVGHRLGFCDLFVPVMEEKALRGVLVCGPVLARAPTLATLKSEWQELTRAPAEPDDESFLRFVRSTLDCHVFEAETFVELVRHLETVARKISGSSRVGGPMISNVEEGMAFRRRVPEAGMWELAAEMVDRESNAPWMASYRATDRGYEGLARLPNHVIAVAPYWSDDRELDPADMLIRTDQLQRLCAALARDSENTVAGRIGSQAAFFLTHIETRSARPRLVSFAERVRRVASRQLGADVFCGFSAAARHGSELPQRYDEAFWALLWGLHNGERHTFHGDRGTRDTAQSPGLYRSARLLYEHFGTGRPRETDLSAEQVVKDVLWISNGSLEVVRSHLLQILWELLALTERRAAIDKRTVSDLLANVSERLRDSHTTQALAGSFIKLTRELAETIERPEAADRKSKLERARRLVEQSDRGAALDLDSIAAKIGMSRSNFTRCFRAAYHTSFSEFVVRSRVERSKQLLQSTTLDASQVSAEAGWSSVSYFCQAFKRTTGMTPGEYQRRTHVEATSSSSELFGGRRPSARPAK
jgi:AraC-like DNA-binding protein